MSALPTASVDVLVVGGGVAGATLAHALARAGVEAMLVNAGTGASSVPAALLNAHRGRSGRATAADLEGMRRFCELTSELEGEGHATGALRSGVLRVPDNAKQARAWQRLAGTTWLEPGAAPPAYHTPFGAMLVGGGWVRPDRLLAALAASAAARGVASVQGVRVLGLEPRPGGLLARTSAGDVSAARVVLCLGAERPEGWRLPALETVWGEALVLAAELDAPYPLAGSVVAAFGAGEVYVSGGHTAAPGPGGLQLREALAWQVPAVSGAEVVRRWQGARAKRPSGEPVARRLGARVYLFGALGGRGFLRAPGLANALAERLRAAPGR